MKLWITAAGTGSAWHISNIAKKYFNDRIELYLSDINDKELVASASIADHFYKVPLVTDSGYKEYMYHILKENDIDVIIPLIPWEQTYFSADNKEFAKLGVKTAAPDIKLSNELNNKIGLNSFCKSQNIPTIELVEKESYDINETYFIKPIEGFGAAGAGKIKGSELNEFIFNNNVVQEYCEGPEITLEVFNYKNKLHTIARQRIESKAGVCTKAKILELPELTKIVEKFTSCFDFPRVFNIQFIKKNNEWKVMDVNLRLAAGTGLSNAAGFQLIRAYILSLLNEDIDDKLFEVDYGIVSILRVYQEVVIR